MKRISKSKNVHPATENEGKDSKPILSARQHCEELLQTLIELGSGSYEGHSISVLRESVVSLLIAILEEERKEREVMRNQEVNLERIYNTLLKYMKDRENQLKDILAEFQGLPVPFKKVLVKSLQQLNAGLPRLFVSSSLPLPSGAKSAAGSYSYVFARDLDVSSLGSSNKYMDFDDEVNVPAPAPSPLSYSLSSLSVSSEENLETLSASEASLTWFDVTDSSSASSSVVGHKLVAGEEIIAGIQRRAEKEEDVSDEGNAKKAEKEMQLKEKKEKKMCQFLNKRKQEHVKRQEESWKDEQKREKRILDETPEEEEAKLKKKIKDEKMKLEARKKWEKGVMKTAHEHRKWRETQNKIQVEEQRKQLKRSMKDQEIAEKKQQKEQKKQKKEQKEREERELKQQRKAAKQEKCIAEKQKKQERFEQLYYRLLANQNARKEMNASKERPTKNASKEKPKMRITMAKKPCFIWNLFGRKKKEERKLEEKELQKEAAGESDSAEEEVDESLIATERDVSRRRYASVDMPGGQSPISIADLVN